MATAAATIIKPRRDNKIIPFLEVKKDLKEEDEASFGDGAGTSATFSAWFMLD